MFLIYQKKWKIFFFQNELREGSNEEEEEEDDDDEYEVNDEVRELEHEQVSLIQIRLDCVIRLG